MNLIQHKETLWGIAACGLMSGVFFLDVSFPFGAIVGLLYVGVILLTWLLLAGRFAYPFAILASLLVVLGYFWSAVQGPDWLALAGRGFTLFAIWSAAYLASAARAAISNLQFSERRFRDFAENASDWFWEMDENLRFSFFSERFSDVSGLDPQSLLGKTREEFDRPEVSEEDWNQLIADLKAHRPIKNFVHARTLADGRKIWLTMNGTPIYEGDVFKGYRGNGTDITERVNHERTIQRLMHAVQHVPVGIALFDEEDRLIFLNEQYKTVMGAMADILVIGETFENMLRTMVTRQPVKDAVGREEAYMKERLAKRQNPGPPVEIHRQDRELLAFESRTPDGFILNIITDITEQKKIEQDLVKARDGAEKANRAKSEFLASMSHELRTPLNAILGFSDILSGQYFGPPGDGKYTEYAKDIHRSGVHLLELVNDLLDISAIEAGKTSLQKEEISILEMLEECHRTIKEKAREKAIDLACTLEGERSSFYADKRAIRQVLLNLLSNAVKFTDTGGKIALQSLTTDHETKFTVTDTGRGIAEHDLPDITNPFTKSINDPMLAEQGWGLGLAISKSLVELHQGQLIIESQLGEGTTVRVVLPY